MIRHTWRATRSHTIVWRSSRSFSTTIALREDPRLQNIGRVIEDEYAVMRDKYGTCSLIRLKSYTEHA